VLVYAVTLHGTYIYDDVKIVHTDPRVLEPDRWYQLWTQPFFARSIDKLYRPLVSSSFALENYLHGDRPWIFHLVNILLHATVSASVALLALRLAGVRAAVAAGGRVLCGGTRERTVITPTLLVDVPEHLRVCAEEAFAPIVVLSPSRRRRLRRCRQAR